MPNFKTPNTKNKNSRRRISENATDSRIAEANEVWHSTAIEEMDEDEDSREHVAPPVETPIRGKKGKVMATGPTASSKKGRLANDGGDSGRGGSTTRDDGDEDFGKVVINPPSGHSFLSSVLQKCGYIIRQPQTNNEMYKDVMKFRKTMADWIVDNEDEMKRIETETSKFYKALDAYLSDKDNFLSSMKPTKHETELIQPSLLNCLLGVEAIQTQVLKIVFVVLTEASLSNTQEDVSLVGTILQQLKWLPSIVDAQKYTDSLLSIVNTATMACQSLIIKFLPDIMPTNLHSKVAEKLLDKFSDEGIHLNIALMDCFSSLDIEEGSWASIRATAIDQMATAPLQDIPSYFAFLFREETVAAVTEVVTAIREKVTLTSSQKSAKSDAYQVEILEKVGYCVTVNPGIVKIWTKQVKHDLQNDLAMEVQKIDLLMLFIFMETHESKTIPTLKMLFAEKDVVVNLFRQMLEENLAMMYPLFSTIAKFLDKVLRSRDTKCMETISEVTVELFLGLSAIEAQTLMGNLTGILINYPPSREIVLQILTNLAEKSSKKLLLFAPYLMGVLEYVMQFPPAQIRSLMNILAILSQTEGRIPGEPTHFSAEFSILLRKQLTHSDLKIRCFGVFGAMASVRRMAQQEIPNDIQIRELLKLAWNFVERDEDACSIFLDELSTCVESLPVDICQMYRDILKGKFQTLWTVDEAANERISQFSKRNNLQLTPAFDANKECTEERLLINFENHPLSMSPLVVPAHLRVLALLEAKVESEDLVGIDAILGCPILFPVLVDYYERDSITDLKYNQRQQLGQYLVLAINFFRESICAFFQDENPELRVKIWLRLENILKLQKFLVQHFDSFPVLPHAYVAEKTIGSSKDGGAGPSGLQGFGFRLGKEKEGKAPAKKAAAKPAKDPPAKKSAKKKAKTDAIFSGSEEEEEENAAAPAAPKKAKVALDEEIQPKKIFPYLRRMDEFVFTLLSFPLRGDGENVNLSRILMDLSAVSQNPVTINRVQTFTPETLALLLTELRRQVQDPRCKLDILKVKKLLRYLCSHMQQIQTILLKNEENDMADITETQTQLECCLRLLIDILINYFDAIKKLDKEKMERAKKRTIDTLATLALQNTEEGGMSSQTEMMANVASYLAGLVSVIKDSSTALDHLKLLKHLHDLMGGHAELKKAIDNSARVYLRSDWKLPSAKVDGFLKIWLGTAQNPLLIIKNLVEQILMDVSDNEEEGDVIIFNSTVFKSCTTSNFHTWYAAMLAGLSQYVYKNLRRRGDLEDGINEWKQAIDIFKRLVSIAQEEFKPKNLKNFILTALLKHCRQFLEAFISGGAELLPQYVKRDMKDAQNFCRALQVPCRIIQHICEHSKIHTDLLLMKSVPLVKRILETLVFRVREVLGAAGASEAFWVGNLKHRNLRGVCIGSQIRGTADMGSYIDTSDDEDEVEAARLSGMSETGGDDDDDDVRARPLSGMTEAGMNEDSMDVDSNSRVFEESDAE